MSEIKDIPKHWEVKKLGEFIVKGGGSVDPSKYLLEDFDLYSIPAYDKGEPELKKGSEIGSTKKIVQENDVLLSRIVPHIQRSWVVAKGGKRRKIGSGEWIVFRGKLFVPMYMRYYLLSYDFHQKMMKTISGVGGSLTRANPNQIALFDIPLPPLPEQQAIVAKIEALLSELDNGKQQLLTAQQQLKVYRQSLLKWAFEGKLTNKNVKEGELPEGWKWVRLGDVCNKIQDGSHFSPQVQYNEPGENRFKYITAKNIRNNYMDFRKIIYVDKDYHDSIYPRCNPEFGDVLLTKDGINTGEVTLNTLHEPFSLLSSVCVFKTKKNELISVFLKYFIQSPFGNKAILDSMTGTAIKRIVLRKIKDAKIILPALDEQQLIVAELESKLTICDKIEETISQSLQLAETLRQSILKQAFEGKLVSIDLITSNKTELL
jgi:type I restriction enzyme S subunit